MVLSVSSFQSCAIILKALYLILEVRREMNRASFKEKNLGHFLETQAQIDGNNVILIVQQGVQQMLKQAPIITRMMQLFVSKQPRLFVKMYSIYMASISESFLPSASRRRQYQQFSSSLWQWY